MVAHEYVPSYATDLGCQTECCPSSSVGWAVVHYTNDEGSISGMGTLHVFDFTPSSNVKNLKINVM